MPRSSLLFAATALATIATLWTACGGSGQTGASTGGAGLPGGGGATSTGSNGGGDTGSSTATTGSGPPAGALPTPSIFIVNDMGGLGTPPSLSGEVPFAVHAAALEDFPEPCTWQPADAGAPCNVEDGNCPVTSAIPAAMSDVIWACLRKRDADYNQSMSTKYLGGGDVLDSKFSWDFGDPGAPYAQVQGYGASHVYDKPGDYTMTLTVRNEQGLEGSVPLKITVVPSTRKEVQIADDAGMAQLFADQPGPRKISLQRGKTFHLSGSNFIHLSSGDWLTTYGDPAAPSPILETSYAGLIKVFATFSKSHLLVEGVEVRVAAGSSRPFIAEPDGGVDVVFRDVVFSNGPGYTGPSRGFTLGGRGVLLENVGAPRNADGSLASSGISANFVFMGGKNISLYGNHMFVEQGDNNAEPGVRTCGADLSFLSVVGNDIGGWYGKDNAISIRGGHNVFLGSNNVLWGVFDLQTGCSPNTFQFPTTNVVIEKNHLENDTFDVNGGVFNASFRDNVVHRQNVQGAPYPLEVSISVEVVGGTDPWSTDRIEIVNNSFLFEPTVGKPIWFLGGQDLSNVVLLNNIFYAPGVPYVIQFDRPKVAMNPWDVFQRIDGNAFFMGPKELVTSLGNGGMNSGLTLAQWNMVALPDAIPVMDQQFDPAATGLTVLGGKVSNNVVEPIESCRPAAAAPYAKAGVNLLDPPPSGKLDTHGVEQDLTGKARPAAGKGGWAPGALEAN